MTPKIVIKDVKYNKLALSIKCAKLSIDRNTRLTNLKQKCTLSAVFVRVVLYS